MPFSGEESASLEGKIKAEALRLGFSLCGITTPNPPQHYDIFEEFLSRGFHAGMRYLETQRHRSVRKQPTLILPEARTIIVCAWQYPLVNVQTDIPVDVAWQAAYSIGSDYHQILPEKLLSLKEYISNQTGQEINGIAITDSMPLLEREIAVRAGLGWVGKNTCLISPKIGSGFLLAELILDLQLTPDHPFEEEHCGTCHRCLEVCPTRCITAERLIDARRCISYLTIENKSDITESLRQSIGGWLFGCDLCQIVCPWNQKVIQPVVNPGFKEWTMERIVELLNLSEEEFTQLFGNSALARSKRLGLCRNALNWLGNQRNPASLPELEKFIEIETNPLLLEEGRWAIRQIRGI